MDTRATILRCARDLYLEEGLTGFSLRNVARAAGVSATAIYRHFEGKDDLLWEVCQQGHEIFGRYLARGLKGKNARERLTLTGDAYLDFGVENKAYYLVMFVAPPEHLGFQKLATKSQDEGAVTFQMLVDRVRECMDAGVIADDDPVVVSFGIWAHVHGLVTLYFRAPQEPSAAVHPGLASLDAFRAVYRKSLDAHVAGLGVSLPR
jgi:AcrR family transcriptional regulator